MKIGIVARRLRKFVDSGVASNPMETVVCDKCGQRFAIHNESPVPGEELTEKHAAWVQDQLVWDHIQERRHQGTMDLPLMK